MRTCADVRSNGTLPNEMNDPEDRWSVAEGTHEGRPLVIRFREFKPEFPRSLYPERLNIFWKMTEPHPNGLPTQSETERLTTFEDRLIEAVEKRSLSVLSVVLTCAGQREFVFHTNDPANFLKLLTEMPQEAERYPIEIYRAEDRDWSYDDSVTQVTP